MMKVTTIELSWLYKQKKLIKTQAESNKLAVQRRDLVTWHVANSE